jgi:hypothetical protein
MDIQELSYDMGRQKSKAINDWLERCVRDYCPEAMVYFSFGDLPTVSDILIREGFHYRILPDGIYVFCLLDTVLARCKLQIQLTSSFKESSRIN